MVFEKVRPSRTTDSAPRPPFRASAFRPIRLRVEIAIAAVLLVLAITALVTMLSPGSAFNLAPATTSQYRPVAVAALMGLLAAGLVALGVVLARSGLRLSARAQGIAWWGFVAACFAAQLVLAHAVLQFPPWDAAQIFEVAYHQAVAPEPRLFPIGDQVAYFSLYPNNAFLVAVFALLFGALRSVGVTGIDQYLWASVVVNCVALTGTLVLVRVVVRRLAPGVATIVSVVLGVVLIVVSPWLNVAYSDTLVMAFPIAMLALWLTWPDRPSPVSRVGLFALLGVLGAIGLAIKPPVLAMTIALLLVTARSGPAGRRWNVRGGIVAVAGLAIGFGLAHEGVAVFTTALFPGFGPGAAMPFTHYMAMGATGDGGFNADDFYRTFGTPEGDRRSAAFALWESRVRSMGPIGYPVFLAEKVLYALSDGSFFQDREGVGPYDRSYFFSDPLSSAVQSVFPLGAPLHWALSSLWQAAWWLSVALCFVPLRRLRLPRPGSVAAMRLSVLFLFAYLCLSESRSRYVYHYLPIVLILAGLGAAAVVAEIAAFRARRASRLTKQPS